MKLKKVLALTLAGIMTVGLAACGGTKESSEKQKQEKKNRNLLSGHGEQMRRRNQGKQLLKHFRKHILRSKWNILSFLQPIMYGIRR